jgi:hypothetical protein
MIHKPPGKGKVAHRERRSPDTAEDNDEDIKDGRHGDEADIPEKQEQSDEVCDDSQRSLQLLDLLDAREREWLTVARTMGRTIGRSSLASLPPHPVARRAVTARRAIADAQKRMRRPK